MEKPYSQLRALMSPDAQAQAEEKARALVLADTDHAAFSAYAVWFRYTYPTAPYAPLYSWQLLATHPEGRSVQAMWADIAHAVNDARKDR